MTGWVATPSDVHRDGVVVPALEAIHARHPFDINFLENEIAMHTWASEVANDRDMHVYVNLVPRYYIKHSVCRSLWKKLGESNPKREHGLIKAMWESMVYVCDYLASFSVIHLARGHVCDASCAMYIASPAVAPAVALINGQLPEVYAEGVLLRLEEATARAQVRAQLAADRDSRAAAAASMTAQEIAFAQLCEATAAEQTLVAELTAPPSTPCPEAAVNDSPIVSAEADDDAPAPQPRRRVSFSIGPDHSCLRLPRCSGCPPAAAQQCADCAQCPERVPTGRPFGMI